MAQRKSSKQRSKPKRSRKSRKQAFRWKRSLLPLLGLLALVAIAAYYRDYFLPEPPPPGRLIETDAELQLALARSGFSPGSLDGLGGPQTMQALRAFQASRGLEPTGLYDEPTVRHLRIEEPLFAQLVLTRRNFDDLSPKPQTWRERGLMAAMGHHTILEKVAEFAQSDPDYIQKLNPGVHWDRLRPGDSLLIPRAAPYRCAESAASIRISLSERTLQILDQAGEVRFHCPVSIARQIEKRPVGELEVTVRVEDPNYTFNPAILSSTAAREGITAKFIIQPGPNNPVGSVWIGLDRPSYGIHGTPEPELVGRTESSGCFRLANWNAQTVLHAVRVGTPVHITR